VPLPTRAPLAVTIHDVLPLTHPQWYTRSQRWTNRAALRNAVDHAAAIIVPSEAVAQDLLEHLGLARDRVTVVPEGVTGSFVQPTDPSVARRLLSRLGVEGGRYLLAVGQVAPRKNLPRLFEALAVMASRGCRPPVLVVAGGDGPGAFDIKAWPERLGVAPYVRWAGHVPDEDAAILVQNARALVHPSLYEGFGLTPLEAMAAGTPVVASAAGSLPEVVGDCGLLLDPGRASMWADAVERVMADDEWCVDASRRGAARAARFTWAAAAAATREVYASIAP
jgi:glycosyltransferase involved in cell wall biosynthesis